MATFTGQPGVAADYLEPGLPPVFVAGPPAGVASYSAGMASVLTIPPTTSLGGLATISTSVGQLAGLATVSP